MSDKFENGVYTDESGTEWVRTDVGWFMVDDAISDEVAHDRFGPFEKNY